MQAEARTRIHKGSGANSCMVLAKEAVADTLPAIHHGRSRGRPGSMGEA